LFIPVLFIILTALNYKVPALLIFMVSLFLNITTAQSLRYPIALPYLDLTAYSTEQQDPFSFTANQAALAQIKQAGIGLYGERRFLLRETSSYTLVTAFPTGMGNFGIQFNYAGFKDFNENKLALAYARALGDKLAIGAQFNYYGYRIPGYNNTSSINFEAGVLLHFSDKLNGGIHVYNPAGTKTVKLGTERLAAAYKIGLGYDASPDFFVSAEIIKEEDKPVNLLAGMQYHFAKQFFVRTGFMSQSSLLFAGAGIGWANLRLDVAGSYHPQLGFSPGLLLIANIENKKK
jgi:hypothetical protein